MLFPKPSVFRKEFYLVGILVQLLAPRDTNMRKLGGERASKPVCVLFLSPLKVAGPAERVDFGLAFL